jgi:hypothetical protein
MAITAPSAKVVFCRLHHAWSRCLSTSLYCVELTVVGSSQSLPSSCTFVYTRRWTSTPDVCTSHTIIIECLQREFYNII